MAVAKQSGKVRQFPPGELLPGEPGLLIRGSDRNAVRAMQEYQRLVGADVKVKSDAERTGLVEAMDELIREVREWKDDHADKVKSPHR